MRRFLFVLVLFIIVFGFLGVISFKNKLNKDLAVQVLSPTITPPPSTPKYIKQEKTSWSLFVPYWALGDENIGLTGIDRLIYFGIKPGADGISGEDKIQLEHFNNLRPEASDAQLALRMTDTQENLRWLGDKERLKGIIEQTTEAAIGNNMSGIVLDLEISAIPFESLTKQINKFAGDFYTACKKKGLNFSITIYGDALYRPRPYDIKTLSQNADGVMIMAYDFHKAKGNPGPNFPLGGKDIYGYDLREMIEDFLQFVPAKKINVIFGLYGYDWQVDENGKSVQQAQSLTYTQMKHKFGGYKQDRDKESGEMRVVYKDNKKNNHVVWFEDMESVKLKMDFLKQKGVNSFSYWAYSYY